MTALDPRLNAFRADLADEELRGRVDAARFVAGQSARVRSPVADLHAASRADSGVNSQLVHGDEVRIFDKREGWAWVQASHDDYVGYTPDPALEHPAGDATHTVFVPRSFVYPGADLKLPVSAALSMGSLVRVVDHAETRGTRYAILDTGEAMIDGHLRLVAESESDYVAVAERLVFTPYLWGGTSGFGLDCSGLIQLAMRMTGTTVLRDSDMQAASVGTALDSDVEVPRDLRRGDLVFWKGHVAILTDRENVIHASGHSMMVSREPLISALERIRPVYGRPTAWRRP